MKIPTASALILSISLGLSPGRNLAQAQDANTVRYGVAAITFASGAIQKITPRDGIVNLITGDNQSSGNRMLLGTRDALYLKLDNPSSVAIGDLFTVYRRVRKVFHPLTKEYLGLVTIRLAVVKVTDIGHALTTAETVVGYGPIVPGDLVMRFADPPPSDIGLRGLTEDLDGMIVELQADKPMTMVSQSNVVYVDRGSVDGLKAGDVMDIHRHSTGLPVRKIGQLKVLSTEEHTATAQIITANTRVFKGDRFKRVGHSEPVVQPVNAQTPSAKTGHKDTVPTHLAADQVKMWETSGHSRINLANLANSLRYESGEAVIKPEGYKVLDQFIEYLVSSGDARLIRVEGHTDNVEIGPSLKARYPSNIDLSKARARSVIRYLIEKGGLDSTRLSFVGYGDSRPVATNANEEGRSKNRRVEIVLYEPTTDPPATFNAVDRQTRTQGGDPSSPITQPDAPPESGSGTLSISGEPPQTVSGEVSTAVTGPDASHAMPSEGEQQLRMPVGDGPIPSISPSASSALPLEGGD